MRDSQHLPGNRRRYRVDVSHVGLAVIIDCDLHRAFHDNGKIDRNRRRPCEPHKTDGGQPCDYTPPQALRPACTHAQSRVLRTATRSSRLMRSRTTKAEKRAATIPLPLASAYLECSTISRARITSPATWAFRSPDRT